MSQALRLTKCAHLSRYGALVIGGIRRLAKPELDCFWGTMDDRKLQISMPSNGAESQSVGVYSTLCSR
jgi:hypothetical protein